MLKSETEVKAYLDRGAVSAPIPSMAGIDWFHSIDLLDGRTTPGRKSAEEQASDAAKFLTADTVRGKSVLDIGAWDGFYSFEAETLGASRVLATDHFCWSSGLSWGTKRGFDYAHAARRSKVESLDVDVFDLDPQKLGQFDLVLFLGVLYHLREPFSGLAKAAAMARETLIVETHADMLDTKEPVMRFYLDGELNGDPTNFFAPNGPCLRNMMAYLGFSDVTLQEGSSPNRLIATGTR